MRTLSKKLIVLLLIYIGITTYFFFAQNRSQEFMPVSFFFQSTDVPFKLEKDISLDSDSRTIILTRLFHNKILSYVHVSMLSLYRSTDVVTLFTLTNWSSLYDNTGPLRLLYPLELPFFALSVGYLIRSRANHQRALKILSSLFVVALIISAALLPAVHPLKLLPLIITVRLCIGIGIFYFVCEVQPLRKALL